MRILHMTLHRKWFDQIAAGTKKEEYREIKPYREKKLSKQWDAICFKNGYHSGCPEMIVEFKRVRNRDIIFPITGERQKIFAIQLGDILKIKNYK